MFISCLEIEKNAFSLREHIPVFKGLYLHSVLCFLGERVVLNKWNGQQQSLSGVNFLGTHFNALIYFYVCGHTHTHILYTNT